jgi:UDP-N-acetylmuramate dehydrogenase
MKFSITPKQNVLLAPYTTYKIGGPADLFIEVNNERELEITVKEARTQNIPFFLLGCGANILIGDGGIRGLVIHNKADSVKINDNEVTAESGAVIADLINITSEKGLSGLEHFAGIPSSVGGALWQNLHFLSPDRLRTVFISDALENAKVLLPNNKVALMNKSEMGFGYDESIFHHKPIVVLEATFKLEVKTKTEIEKIIVDNLAWRAEKQPSVEKFPSCGSVFKKIAGVGAGRLIDQAQLKGKSIGGAMVAKTHANFIVNMGGAKARDVRNLIELVQKTVKDKTGYSLETEIKFIGEFS